MRSRVYGRRALLNGPGYESTGAIVAEAYLGDYGTVVTWQLSDCSRAVTLEIQDPLSDSTSDERFQNDLDKLQTVIDCTRELQKALRSLRRRRRVE